MRLENLRYQKHEKELTERIEFLLKERDEMRGQLNKIQKQSYSAHELLTNANQITQRRQIHALNEEVDSLRVEKSIITDHFGHDVV